MRCDRLASVIFRAAGSIFASRSARLAREIPRPTAKASEPRKTRSARPAALAARRSWNLERPRHCLQNRPTQTPHRFRFLPLSQTSDTLHKAPKSHPLDHFHHCATNQPPRPHPRPKTPDRLDLHTHRNHRITIVLSSSSRPLANPNLHAFRCSLNASKSPPEHHYLQTPKPSSHHPSSPPHIINQSPFSRSPSDPLTDPLHLSKTSL